MPPFSELVFLSKSHIYGRERIWFIDLLESDDYARFCRAVEEFSVSTALISGISGLLKFQFCEIQTLWRSYVISISLPAESEIVKSIISLNWNVDLLLLTVFFKYVSEFYISKN